jgi:hypothetical protein
LDKVISGHIVHNNQIDFATMAMASGAPYELESLVQDDFLRDLRASDIDVVPLDTTDLILDAYENDEFWLSADSSATPKQIHANNLQLGHPGSSRAVFARSRDASPQVEILYKLQHIPAELMVERKPQSPIATANRAVKQGQLYKKVRASRIKKSMQTKGKRQRGTTDSAPVLPLSAYNFFFSGGTYPSFRRRYCQRKLAVVAIIRCHLLVRTYSIRIKTRI